MVSVADRLEVDQTAVYGQAAMFGQWGLRQVRAYY